MESKSPVICVPVCERNLHDLENAIMRAKSIADVVEVRLDCLEPLGENFVRLQHLLANFPKPTILTYRPAEQGGKQDLDTKARLKFWLFDRPATNGFLDMEFDLVRNANVFDPENSPDWKRVICSYHNFTGFPANLDDLYREMAKTRAGILKIAVHASDAIDCLPIFRLLEHARAEGREIIAIAMGAAGIATRILGPSRGAFLTYASVEPEDATAPGQITAQDLKEIYRVGKLNRQTQILGLIGQPVSQSVSPHIHNAAFESSGVNAVYIPFEVRDLAGFITRMVRPSTREIDWKMPGLSVTTPHKVAVMAHLDWIEPTAQEIDAVNTIVVEGDRLKGYNTDAKGFLLPLTQALGELRDARCAIIGAGGAAKAAVWALHKENADVTVFAREPEKAEALAEGFDGKSSRLAGARFKGFDVVVNATPLGTFGQFEDETPATAVQLAGARLAYDLVYNPVETRFLREARETGCGTLAGFSMLVAQAAEQFKLWTAMEAPTAVMLEAVKRRLLGS